MKNFIDKAKRFLPILYVFPILIFTETILSSCTNDELEIQQNFPFEISVMPVPKNIAKGETVEIRLRIQPSGNFTETRYYLRYFQFDGSGALKFYDKAPFLPNDMYEFSQKEFRLYYTSSSTMSQNFKIWIMDSFGIEKELEFQFDNKD